MPVTIKKLKLLDIHTFGDLLNYFPTRYENYSLISTIDKVQEGETVTIKGTITDSKNVYTKKGVTIQKIVVEDNTGSIEVVWYNQPYLARLFQKGAQISVAGIGKKFLHTVSVDPKEYEIIKVPDQPSVHTARIVPTYSEKYGLSSKTVREKIFKVINRLINAELLDWLPQDIISSNVLMSEYESIIQVHFPSSTEKLQSARRRLSFDELFILQLSSAIIRKEWQKEVVSSKYEVTEQTLTSLNAFINNLPFQLTDAQKRVWDEIRTDLKKPTPMNRFLQGDVGSGKTVVAAIAAYLAFLNGYRTLFMAPTEILAQQHYNTLTKLFDLHKTKVGIQTGSKKHLTEAVENGASRKAEFDILVGTQALLTETVKVDKVGLIIIDEQHRFGVAQRAMLKQKGINPHLLTMTATPIPRTVALTLYGELDLSIIDEFPKGRLPIKTYLVPKVKRESGYQWMKSQIAERKTQIFVICPLIEESETETMSSVRATKKEYEYLKNSVFKNHRVGLLHGKMKPKEKEQVMIDFKNKTYDILVSTSVVEVGIDVPNASIMMIEGAERFGLAQLHQLRGRVGRGVEQSYCLLFTSEGDEATQSRLKFFAATLSGQKLAEFDFKIRGPGQIFGTQQSGYTDLKIANLGDYTLIDQVKKSVGYFMNHYNIEEYEGVKKKVEKHRVGQITRD